MQVKPTVASAPAWAAPLLTGSPYPPFCVLFATIHVRIVPKIETALTRDRHIRPPHNAQVVNDCYAKDDVEHIKALN